MWGIIADVAEVFEPVEHWLLASLQIVLLVAARIVDVELDGHARLLAGSSGRGPSDGQVMPTIACCQVSRSRR